MVASLHENAVPLNGSLEVRMFSATALFDRLKTPVCCQIIIEIGRPTCCISIVNRSVDGSGEKLKMHSRVTRVVRVSFARPLAIHCAAAKRHITSSKV
jgi:hypothetical protein